MKITKDDRKHELFRILKNLYFLTEKEKFDEYMKLKKVYNKLMQEIFGNITKKGDEGFEYDLARNCFDHLFMSKSHYEFLKKPKEEVISAKREALLKALKLMNQLEGYL